MVRRIDSLVGELLSLNAVEELPIWRTLDPLRCNCIFVEESYSIEDTVPHKEGNRL